MNIIRVMIALTIAVCIPAVSFGQYNFGYRPNEEATKKYVASLESSNLQFSKRCNDEESLQEKEEEFQNYRFEMKCLESNPALKAKYMNGGRKVAPNQGSVGSCTGFGTAGVLNIAFAKFCIDNGIKEWYNPISESAAYAIGREEGGILGHGDGGYGSACAKSTQTIGMLVKIPYPTKDLTNYTESDARDLGRNGIGKYQLKPQALKMVAQTVIPIKTITEAKVAIKEGMGINVCSQQAFRTQRDANGICEADNSRTWAHSMTIVGYRTVNMGGKLVTLFRIQQSWGNSNPSGPLVGDMGYGMFDVRENVIASMLKMGDSFAYGNLKVLEAPKASHTGSYLLISIIAVIALIILFQKALLPIIVLIVLYAAYSGIVSVDSQMVDDYLHKGMNAIQANLGALELK